MRIAVVATHPIQYYAPLFRVLADGIDLHVFYGQLPDGQQQADAGFGFAFEWDVDLRSGYQSSVLANIAKNPNVNSFNGCDSPTIGPILRSGNFDALIVFGWYQKFLVQSILAAKRQGIPVLVRGDSQLSTPRNPLKRMAKEAAYPAFLRAFDAALYVGKNSREYYRHYHFPEDRLFFSPHCIDTDFFTQHSSPEARAMFRRDYRIDETTPLVLFAGKLIDLKRPGDILGAVARLRAAGSNAEVAIAGSGPLENEIKAMASANNVPLHYLGFCNQSKMPSVYASADVLCLPSAHDTWGLACNEALACGTPIVVSDQVGCAPDLAADGSVGRQFVLGDIDGLANALAATIASPPSKNAIASLSERYSVAEAARGIKEAISMLRTSS